MRRVSVSPPSPLKHPQLTSNRAISSFLFSSLTKSTSREGRSPSSDRSRSPSRRSLSPFRRHKGGSRDRDSSAEGLRRDPGAESEPESDSAPVFAPSNAFDTESDSEEEDLYEEGDEEMERNTEVSWLLAWWLKGLCWWGGQAGEADPSRGGCEAEGRWR